MIDAMTRARILRLHLVEHWLVATIAREVGVHHTTVARVLRDAGASKDLALADAAAEVTLPSLIDPFVPFIVDTLQRHPGLKASRLHAMCKERGYRGGADHFRHRVALLRPRKPAEAFLRLRTLPGEQGQCDWAHFGTVRVGRATRKLYGFVLVLSYSRRIFLYFCFNIGMPGFVRGHRLAFAAFGGVPRVVLYDNLKSAVLERVGEAIVFHPTLLELASHYRYEPRPVAPARGNQKGRVERAVQYVRSAFFAGMKFKDLEDLNDQARTWTAQEAACRKCPGDPTMTVEQAFEAERPSLVALPAQPFVDHERVEVRVAKTPYVRFDLNDYSVSAQYVCRQLVVFADETSVRIADGGTLVAEHPRTFDQGQQIESPAHIEALRQHKAKAQLHRSQQVLMHAAPQAQTLLNNLAAQGANLGSAVSALLTLLDSYGAPALQHAIDHALAQKYHAVSTVRRFLEQRRGQTGPPPQSQVALPPHLAGLNVLHKAGTDYDHLAHKGPTTKEK